MRFSPATGRWSKMISSPRAFSDCMRGSSRGPTIGSWRFQSSHVIATNGCDRRMRRRTSLMPSLCARRAVARKKFNGVIARVDGGSETLDWQTLYFCAKRDDAWKITSFVGYLPRLLGEDNL